MNAVTGNNLFISVSPIAQKVIITSGLYASAQTSLESLSIQLCATAENLYLSRNYRDLAQVADVLCSLPLENARAAGLYYRALCLCRRDDLEAARLLELSLSCNQPRYTARAIQTLGAIYQKAGDSAVALEHYRKAASLASTSARIDFPTLIRSAFTISELHSVEGDHYSALTQLCEIRPAVELVSKVQPYYAGLYCNEVAFELSCVGRIDAARRYAQFAISSPFVRAYPEWTETAQEIEQQAEAKAALNVRPAIQQARKISFKPKLRLVKKPYSVALPAATRRITGPVVIIRPEQPRSRPTLEQISFKIQIRAPSF